VTTIEESKDLEEMKIEELVGSLQTYEYSLPPARKAKTIALKASKKTTKVSSDEDSDIDEDLVAMLAKNFEQFMKNNKFKKKFSGRLKKAPQTAELKEAEKKDPRGPQCYECSGFWHIKTECANLKKTKGKAFNATFSDESEKEKETPEEEKFLAFVAPYEEKKDSQSYYSENSDEEDMKTAYQLQYIEFLKLREKYKQQVLELNSLRTKKTTMLIQINDLEERLLETQLQLERVTGEKLTHMLSIQKCLTDKTGLGMLLLLLLKLHLLPKLFLWNQRFPNLHPHIWIKEKLLWKEKFQISLSLKPSLRSEESLPHAITVVSLGISDISALINKLKGSHTGRLLKLSCVTNVESAVMSGPGVLHLKRSHPCIMNLFPEILFQGISSRGLLHQRRLGSPRNLIWRDQRLLKKEAFYEGTPSVNSFMLDLVRYLELQLKKGGQDKEEDAYSPRGSGPVE